MRAAHNGPSLFVLLGCLLCQAVLSSLAMAQQFPVKPIRIISTTPPGGVNDTICRAFALQISQSVGQPVLVENRPGGNSVIGMMALLRSPPDGYTVGIATSEPMVYNPLLYSKLPYDPDRDFIPISQLSRGDGIIVGSTAMHANTFPEVIALAKANPGKINFATIGPSSTGGLYLKWINRQNGTDIEGIAYKGAGPTITALMSGEVHLTYQSVGFVLANIKAGRLKPIAVTGSSRSPLFPGIATLAEFNSEPGFESNFGAFVPRGTPVAIVQRLNAEFVKATHTTGVQQTLSALFFEPVGNSSAEFAERIRVARADAARVFKILDIRPTALQLD